MAIPTVALASVLVFVVGRLGLTNPKLAAVGIYSSQSAKAEFDRRFGLDDPLTTQYWRWLKDVLHGDLGESLINHNQVSDLVRADGLVTLQLAAGALVLALLIGFGLGLLGGLSRRPRTERAVAATSVVSLAVPQFWLGTVLLIVFGVTLHLFPSGGYVAFGEDPEQWLRSMVLPWLTLAAAPAGLLARVVQIRVREQSALPHVVTATALGASRPRVVCSYVLRNSLSEPLTVIGIQCGYMIGGAFLVEQVFNLPGIGADAIHAAQQGDYPVVQAAALYAIVAFLIVSVVVDLSILGLDVRRQGRRQ